MTVLALALGVGACGTSDVARNASQPSGRGDARDSLLRASNLSRALAKMRARAGAAGTVSAFKLDAGSVRSEVQRGGAAESLVVTKRLLVTEVPTPPIGQPGVPLAGIDPTAPERIVAALSLRAGVTLRDVDYFAVVPEPGSGQPRWIVYLHRGRGTFSANVAGGDVKPLGQP